VHAASWLLRPHIARIILGWGGEERRGA
jgi:hypothetical protein